MNRTISPLPPDEKELSAGPSSDNGFGAIQTARGVLPLKGMDVQARIDGLLSLVSIRQTFFNAWDEPLEATYIFPLPDRAAVTMFRLEVAGRVVEGRIEERAKAREEYDLALAAGHQAGIAEEERPGVFTLRVGNLPPGEQATIHLELAGTLPFADGEVTFRFPLVVAPRYIPGRPLPGVGVGSGARPDTDVVPDASRISPPVLLPGFPNPVRLSLAVEIHETLALVDQLQSSLHAVTDESRPGVRRVVVVPGERLNRDFILRFRLGGPVIETAISLHPESGGEGTFALTVVPPTTAATTAVPRDLFFLLDRSGSMDGWKMVAARRALARMIDSLRDEDRFNVIAFDDRLEYPAAFPHHELVSATDRERFRAVEFLAKIDSRAGTEMAAPLQTGIATLAGSESHRERVLVLVTDGQVGNEDQLVKMVAQQAVSTHIVTVGIDRAVNEAFLRRLAELGGKRSWSECVESEERLDAVMRSIHRRIGTPVLTELTLESEGFSVANDTLIPGKIPDLFSGVPLLVLGRYQGENPHQVRLRAKDNTGEDWTHTLEVQVRENPAIASVWARGQIRKLEDRYVVDREGRADLERRIVTLSETFHVLSRFTAFIAVDQSQVVTDGRRLHKITQPVELPQGWSNTLAPSASRGMPKHRSHRAFRLMKATPERPNELPSLHEMSPAQAAPPIVGGHGPSTRRSDATSERHLAGLILKAWRTRPPGDIATFFQANRDWVVKLQSILDNLRLMGGFDAEVRVLEQLAQDLYKRLGQSPPSNDELAEILGRIERFLIAFSEGKPVDPTVPEPSQRKTKTFWQTLWAPKPGGA